MRNAPRVDSMTHDSKAVDMHRSVAVLDVEAVLAFDDAICNAVV